MGEIVHAELSENTERRRRRRQLCVTRGIDLQKLLRRFTRHMPFRDVLHLIVKPFLGQKVGATNAEVISRAVEHADLKSAAADLTQLADDALENALRSSKAERERIDAMVQAGL